MTRPVVERVTEWFKNNGGASGEYSSIEMNKILILIPASVTEEQLKETLRLIPRLTKATGNKVGVDIRL